MRFDKPMNFRNCFSGTYSIFPILILVTLFVHVPLYLMYGVARLTGALPSEREWYHMQGKGGPWLDTPQGFAFIIAFLAMLALPLVTFALSLGLSLTARHQ